MSRSRIPSMITDSNQACLAKMTGRRVQEVLYTLKPNVLTKCSGKNVPDLIVPVRSNPDFQNSILELKGYGLLLDLGEDFINGFLNFNCLSYRANNSAII
jgi:hypothetical protein